MKDVQRNLFLQSFFHKTSILSKNQSPFFKVFCYTLISSYAPFKKLQSKNCKYFWQNISIYKPIVHPQCTMSINTPVNTCLVYKLVSTNIPDKKMLRKN